MDTTESREKRAERFSKIWWQSRMDAKKSQEFMALHLGVSKRTIQNWEHGVSCPNLFQSTEWFDLLGLNPLHYYLEFLHPSLFNGKPLSSLSDKQTEEQLIALIRSATTLEKQQLLYLIAGAHGSSWYSLLQMFTAHCHTSMRSRVSAARMIAESYEMEAETGALVCQDDVPPDMNVLNFAINQGKQAAQDGKSGYTAQNEK